MDDVPSKPIQLEGLRRQIALLERKPHLREQDTPVSSGCGPLDRLLPRRGIVRGSLVEWLAAGEGTAIETVALGSAAEACRAGGVVVVVDPRREFYPLEAVRQGIRLDQLVVVYATGKADYAWAVDQAMRCPGVAAVLARLDAQGRNLDGRTFRRLQLAAEGSGAIGLLVRPASARNEPSWADVRLLVEPLPSQTLQGHRRRLRIHLLRCRGGTGPRSTDVEIDDETHTVHLAAELADPTAPRCKAGD